ncbi:probable cytochrome P450 6a13 [Photinus pyralis]|nr:probable cytochrome P450 6a13 [Photinus pyralis]
MFVELGLFFAFALLLTIYVRWKYAYWKKKNVPYTVPQFPFGNAENPFTRKYYFGEWLQKFYQSFKKRGEKHAGIYIITSPNYVPIDPEIIKNIMQRDFAHFVDRGFYYNEKDEPLSAHLFAIGGQKWRNLRTKLTPTFTSGKMKMMFDTLVECTRPLEEIMNDFCASTLPVDIKDLLARFTTDVIGSCAFGLECNSFKSDNAEFRYHGRKIFEPKNKIDTLKILFSAARPEWARKLGVVLLPKDSTSFFFDVVKSTVNYRRTNNIHRKDMLQIVMDLEHPEKPSESSLSLEEIAAQAFVFFLAGFETSSTTMTFCLYELAANLDLQQKVRDEINQVLKSHNGKITYDAIMEMKYMNQVIDETLRKYPPVAFLTRQCVKDYVVPDQDVQIEKGTMVLISVLGLHRDPEYFKDPEKFDPERFSDENKHGIAPFTYIPFGEGPRLCIGMRFGMMQTKVGLACLLRNYSFSVSSRTQTPFKWDKFSFILTTEQPIWLDVRKIT